MVHVINASDASICLCVCDASVYPLPDLSPASQAPEAHPRPPPPLPPPLLLSLQPSFLLPSRLGDVLGAFYSSPRLLSLHSVTPSHRPSPLPPLIVSSQLLLSSHSPRKMIFFFSFFFFLHWEMFPRKKVAPQLDEDAWLDTRLRSSSVFFFLVYFCVCFLFLFARLETWRVRATAWSCVCLGNEGGVCWSCEHSGATAGSAVRPSLRAAPQVSSARLL